MKLSTLTALTMAAAIAIGCRSNNGNNMESANEPAVISYDDSTETPNNDIYLNQVESSASIANDLARFLAGKADDKYAALQTSDHYKTYSTTAQQTWDDLRTRTQLRIGARPIFPTSTTTQRR